MRVPFSYGVRSSPSYNLTNLLRAREDDGDKRHVEEGWGGGGGMGLERAILLTTDSAISRQAARARRWERARAPVDVRFDCKRQLVWVQWHLAVPELDVQPPVHCGHRAAATLSRRPTPPPMPPHHFFTRKELTMPIAQSPATWQLRVVLDLRWGYNCRFRVPIRPSPCQTPLQK